MEFKDLKTAIDEQFKRMCTGTLFVTDASKDELWETYLKSFPEGSNPIYKERTEHDCNCCKQFIRTAGKIVAVVDNKLVSIWDINIGEHYQAVADAMSALVKSKPIRNVFLHDAPSVGVDKNRQQIEGGEVITWNHFHCKLPVSAQKIKNVIGSQHSYHQSNQQVLKRSLEEITIAGAETVLDLISQGSLYRGEEHRETVKLFIKSKVEYDTLPAYLCDNFCWVLSNKLGGSSKIKNTVIGTLLSDISSGIELDSAVKSFEAKVAPANYKRPKALITPKMIANAQEKVKELGLEDALPRRCAVTEDLTINNILFANRDTKQAMDVFDEMTSEAAVSPKSFKKVEEVKIDKFIADILPHATGLELLLENNLAGNMVSLIAPVNADIKRLFKWENNFSWSYAGEVADSIKERVKRAGGNVEGVLRCSLSWRNYDDLDIHVREPGGNHIFYKKKDNRTTSGQLDVDMNAGGVKSREAVENITWLNQSKMEEGRYVVKVHNYQLRETRDVGFEVEIECQGETFSFSYAQAVSDKEYVTVAEFDYSHEEGVKLVKSLPSTHATKEIWGLKTNGFRKVNMVMNSPNHWDGEETGNKHWFFMLDGCKNEEPARGFFNEFLRNDLTEHRKVFEVLGAKMKAPLSDNQLSGLGFSSTQRNSVTCRVTGTFNRVIKIKF
jgi:hypothetical protein